MAQISRYGPSLHWKSTGGDSEYTLCQPTEQPRHHLSDRVHESDTLLAPSDVIELSPLHEQTSNTTSRDDRDSDAPTAYSSSALSDDKLSGQRSPRYHVFRWWIWETWAMLIVIGIMVAIIVLFASFNNIELANWRSSMTPNSLAALLATILRTLMIFIVASVLSHWKWTWMGGKTRPLNDFRVLDLGSRGLVGALLVLSRFILRHPVPVAASLVIISSLGIATCVQQSITIANRLSPASSSSDIRIPYVSYVPNAPSITDYPTSLVVDIKYALSTALNDQKAPQLALNLSCSTGNCTFPSGDPVESEGQKSSDDSSTYSTVGICHRCSDISNLIRTNITNTTFATRYYHSSSGWTFNASATLPNGLSIAWMEQQIGFDVGTGEDDFLIERLRVSAANCSWWDDQDMDGPTRTALRWSLANFTILSWTSAGCAVDKARDCQQLPGSSDATQPLAVACYLYPCMRTYGRPSIEAAKLKEPLIFSTPLELSAITISPGDPKLYNSTPGNWSPAPPGLTEDIIDPFDAIIFTAIKSPCKIANSVYTSHNMTMASNLSQIMTWKIDSRNMMNEVISIAPPECLYSMHAGFWHALRTRFFQTPSTTESGASQLYNASIFDGVCQDKPQSACLGGSLPWPALMNEQWLSSIAHNGSSSLASIDGVVGSFADSMTTSFRTTLGTKLPLNFYWFGEGLSNYDFDRLRVDSNYIQGSTLLLNPVIEITWEWLLLPVSLTIIMTVLLIWSIVQSWRQRRTVPVWKDDILLPMMYRHHFALVDDSALSLDTLKAKEQEESASDGGDQLAEPNVLSTWAEGCQVRFRPDRGGQLSSSVVTGKA